MDGDGKRCGGRPHGLVSSFEREKTVARSNLSSRSERVRLGGEQTITFCIRARVLSLALSLVNPPRPLVCLLDETPFMIHTFHRSSKGEWHGSTTCHRIEVVYIDLESTFSGLASASCDVISRDAKQTQWAVAVEDPRRNATKADLEGPVGAVPRGSSANGSFAPRSGRSSRDSSTSPYTSASWWVLVSFRFNWAWLSHMILFCVGCFGLGTRSQHSRGQ